MGGLYLAVVLWFPSSLRESPADERGGQILLLVLSTIFLGLPAFAAVWMLLRPPTDTRRVDRVGIRRVGGRREWQLRWEELRGIAISARTVQGRGRSGVRALNRRRTLAVVLAPVDEVSFSRPGLVGRNRVLGYSRELPLTPALFSTRDPDVFAKLAHAFEQSAPHLYAGIFREGE